MERYITEKIINEERETQKRSKKFDPIKTFFTVIQTILSLSFIACIIFGNSLVRRYSLILLVFLLVFHLLSNIFRFNDRSNYKSYARIELKMFPYIDPLLIATTGFVLSAMIIFSGMKATYVMFENPYEQTSLITNSDEVIQCTPRNMLIGKSEKYYFLYNRVDSSMRVLKRDDIKKEVIRSTDNVGNIFFRF